jgi:hypothetical protein
VTAANEIVQSPKSVADEVLEQVRAGPSPTRPRYVEASGHPQTPYDQGNGLQRHTGGQVVAFAVGSPAQLTIGLPKLQPGLQRRQARLPLPPKRQQSSRQRLTTACCVLRRGEHEMWDIPRMMVS